jgi:hypothetical protein
MIQGGETRVVGKSSQYNKRYSGAGTKESLQ